MGENKRRNEPLIGDGNGREGNEVNMRGGTFVGESHEGGQEVKKKKK